MASDREEVRDHYQGHEIDFDTAVDRFEIMKEGANPNPPTLDDDTEAEVRTKGKDVEPENPYDPYCTC